MAKVAKIEEAAERGEVENSKGEVFTFAAIGQQRASVKAQLATGFAAVLAAVTDKGNAETAVEETAHEPVIIAAQAIAYGLIGKDDVSEMLCEAFGRAEKSPTAKSDAPSKTPAGYGLTIRKRAVCFSQAIGIASGEVKPDDFPKWAQGKDVEAISAIVQKVIAGEKSASVAYRDLTEKERGATVQLPFDAAKLTKIAEALADSVSRAKIAESPALVAAYEAIALAWSTEPAPIAF